VQTGKSRTAFDWGIGEVYSVCFAADGMRAAAGGQGAGRHLGRGRLGGVTGVMGERKPGESAWRSAWWGDTVTADAARPSHPDENPPPMPRTITSLLTLARPRCLCPRRRRRPLPAATSSPRLSRAGCNSGACHGLAARQRTASASACAATTPTSTCSPSPARPMGRRTDVLHPDASLLLLKGSGRGGAPGRRASQARWLGLPHPAAVDRRRLQGRRPCRFDEAGSLARTQAAAHRRPVAAAHRPRSLRRRVRGATVTVQSVFSVKRSRGPRRSAPRGWCALRARPR